VLKTISEVSISAWTHFVGNAALFSVFFSKSEKRAAIKKSSPSHCRKEKLKSPKLASRHSKNERSSFFKAF
jgi:hypothetical protein